MYSGDKETRNAKVRARYCLPEVKKQHKNRILKYKFGITLEKYNQIFTEQEGKCKICKRHQQELGRTLAVDHNHITGKVRGLLCDFCNRQLGVWEKRRDLFSQFDLYLMESE